MTTQGPPRPGDVVVAEPPPGSQVRDRDGDIWTRRLDGWRLGDDQAGPRQWVGAADGGHYPVTDFSPLTLVRWGPAEPVRDRTGDVWITPADPADPLALVEAERHEAAHNQLRAELVNMCDRIGRAVRMRPPPGNADHVVAVVTTLVEQRAELGELLAAAVKVRDRLYQQREALLAQVDAVRAALADHADGGDAETLAAVRRAVDGDRP